MSEYCAPELGMYGYCVAWRKRQVSESQKPSDLPRWMIEQCDEYLNLPAHYLALEEAMDRAVFMRARGYEARVVALVAETTDSAEEFSRNRVGPVC